jgi:hypothetical protein
MKFFIFPNFFLKVPDFFNCFSIFFKTLKFFTNIFSLSFFLKKRGRIHQIIRKYSLLSLRQHPVNLLLQDLGNNLPVHRAPDLGHDNAHQRPECRLLLLMDKI